jgi:hypothetical protein
MSIDWNKKHYSYLGICLFPGIIMSFDVRIGSFISFTSLSKISLISWNDISRKHGEKNVELICKKNYGNKNHDISTHISSMSSFSYFSDSNGIREKSYDDHLISSIKNSLSISRILIDDIDYSKKISKNNIDERKNIKEMNKVMNIGSFTWGIIWEDDDPSLSLNRLLNNSYSESSPTSYIPSLSVSSFSNFFGMKKEGSEKSMFYSPSKSSDSKTSNTDSYETISITESIMNPNNNNEGEKSNENSTIINKSGSGDEKPQQSNSPLSQKTSPVQSPRKPGITPFFNISQSISNFPQYHQPLTTTRKPSWISNYIKNIRGDIKNINDNRLLSSIWYFYLLLFIIILFFLN